MKLVSLFFLFSFSASLFSQEFDVNLSPILKTKEGNRVNYYFWEDGSEANSILREVKKRSYLGIARHDKLAILKCDDSFNILEEMPLDIPFDHFYFLGDMHYMDNTHFLLFKKDRYIETVQAKPEFYMASFNDQGGLIDTISLYKYNKKHWKRKAVEISNPEISYSTTFSPDSSKLYLVVSHKGIAIGSKSNFKYLVSCFDFATRTSWSKMVQSNHLLNQVALLNIEGDDFGNCFLLTRVFERKSGISKKVNGKKVSAYALELLKIGQQDPPETFSISNSNGFIPDSKIKVNKKNQIIFVGFLSEKRENNHRNAILYKKIDAQTFTEVHSNISVFTQDHFDNIIKESDLKVGLSEYDEINDILITPYDEISIICRRVHSPTVSSSTGVRYQFNQAIDFIRLSPDGTIKWAVTLPHGHHFENADPASSTLTATPAQSRTQNFDIDFPYPERGILTKETKDETVIIFNVSPSILKKDLDRLPKPRQGRSAGMKKVTIAAYLVDSSGTYERVTLFPKDVGIADMERSSISIKSTIFLFISEKGMKFGGSKKVAILKLNKTE